MLCLVAQSRPTLCDPLYCSPPGSTVHEDSPGKCTGVGCHALLKGIFPSQGLNPGLPHCRQILYGLSHQGSPFPNNSIFPLISFPPWLSKLNQQYLYTISRGFHTAKLKFQTDLFIIQDSLDYATVTKKPSNLSGLIQHSFISCSY